MLISVENILNRLIRIQFSCSISIPELLNTISIIITLSKAERVAIEYEQRKFTKALLFTDRSMGYRDRCRKLQLDPLWLRRLKLNLIFLQNIIHKRTHLAAGLPTTAIRASFSLHCADTLLVYPRSIFSFHQYYFPPYYSFA